MSSNASDPEPFDDETVRIPRAETKDADAAADADGAVDERTALSARRAGAAPAAQADDLEATALSRSAQPATPVADAPDSPGPRRAPVEEAAPEPDEGSTMVVRRETRRRAARDLEAQAAESPGGDALLASTRAADVPAPVRRIARAPEPPATAYVAREPNVARVERTAPGAHPPQDYVDTAAVDASARARRRVGVIVGIVLGVCALAAAAAGIVALVTAG